MQAGKAQIFVRKVQQMYDVAVFYSIFV